MTADDPFVCPNCRGTYFGSSSHKRKDGTWIILSRTCHDQFEVGCHATVTLTPTPTNPVMAQDFIDDAALPEQEQGG